MAVRDAVHGLTWMPTAASTIAMPPKMSISVMPSSCRRSVPPTTSDARSKSTAMLGLSFRISARMARSTALGSYWDI